MKHLSQIAVKSPTEALPQLESTYCKRTIKDVHIVLIKLPIRAQRGEEIMRERDRKREEKRSERKQRPFVSSTEMRGQQNRPEETVNPHLGYEAVTRARCDS